MGRRRKITGDNARIRAVPRASLSAPEHPAASPLRTFELPLRTAAMQPTTMPAARSGHQHRASPGEAKEADTAIAGDDDGSALFDDGPAEESNNGTIVSIPGSIEWYRVQEC